MKSDKKQPEIITVTLNPAVDRTLYFEEFQTGQVNRVYKERSDPGGKGINVAKVIKALGNAVTVTGFLGMDNTWIFRDYFNRENIKNCFIEINGATRANIKIVDEKNGQVSEINFPGLPCTAEDLCRLETTVKDLAVPGNLFVLSGSLPQGVSTGIYRRFIEYLQSQGCRVFLDASGEALAEGIKAKPYMVKPNLSELSQLTGRALQATKDIMAAIDEILDAGVARVVVSLGDRGALAADGAQRLMVRPPRVQANSTVGAGDALVAGLVVGEAQGFSLQESMRLATAAAAASVAKPGTQAGTLVDIEKLLTQVTIEKLEESI